MKLEEAQKLPRDKLKRLSRKQREDILEEYISRNTIEIDDSNNKI